MSDFGFEDDVSVERYGWVCPVCGASVSPEYAVCPMCTGHCGEVHGGSEVVWDAKYMWGENPVV